MREMGSESLTAVCTDPYTLVVPSKRVKRDKKNQKPNPTKKKKKRKKNKKIETQNKDSSRFGMWTHMAAWEMPAGIM